MPTYKITNALQPAKAMELSSDTMNFDRLVLELCDGGMTVQSTAKAMETRRQLLGLARGASLTVKKGRQEVKFERL